MFLKTKDVHQITGLSISTLKQGRTSRPDLNTPPSIRVPEFKGTRDPVRYDLNELTLWMSEVGRCGGKRGAIIASKIIEKRIKAIEDT